MKEQKKDDISYSHNISALILAAGLSKRMGQPKMILPWGSTTVIGQVAAEALASGLSDIVVVTGGSKELVERALEGFPVRFVYNPQYANGEMLGSVQTGIRALPENCDAFCLTLGDQPTVTAQVFKALISRYNTMHSKLVIPSFQMRRGHPWLVARSLWSAIEQLVAPLTLRNFLEEKAGEIDYVVVDSPGILIDLDTPEDYIRQSPQL